MRNYDIDFDHLLKLRLVVARFGEMDMMRWWNCQGLLGKHGKMAIARGFPKTHYFVQARIVFTVAKSRCMQLFNPPGCITLWNLPAEIENTFNVIWQSRLAHSGGWETCFQQLETIKNNDLLQIMEKFNLITQPLVDFIQKLPYTPESRTVLIPGTRKFDNEVLTILAGGFSKGKTASPVIPYIFKENLS